MQKNEYRTVYAQNKIRFEKIMKLHEGIELGKAVLFQKDVGENSYKANNYSAILCLIS